MKQPYNTFRNESHGNSKTNMSDGGLPYDFRLVNQNKITFGIQSGPLLSQKYCKYNNQYSGLQSINLTANNIWLSLAKCSESNSLSREFRSLFA